ncbi:hypothetical protein OAJ53_01140 [Pelagibacteraceae bacterium]|mgnify:FL=1|jgi:hypothetical protein|nr:hypothetical protein [Pelagibacteraceae bacterium]|tara:strand:- start:81 stop:500 length:420 start_codon:yes stop_codon:yes gene_type:complete
MKKYVYFLFLVILVNYNVINASEKISLISLNDIKIIFSTDAKTWNQNLVFLDKKLSMKKLQLDNNSNYSLKTTFSNGYVVITPYFKLDLVESLNINYYFNSINKKNTDSVLNHFQSLDKDLCNYIKVDKNDIFIDMKNC